MKIGDSHLFSSAIVLAAGESRRMGAQKLLLPYGGETVIARIVDQLLGSVINQVVVVVGHEGARIVEALAGRDVTFAENPDYASGMLSSVRCGLRALDARCQGVMVCLGDQPSITSKLVNDLVRAFTANDKGIVVPVFREKHGHPLIFSGHYRDDILTRFDDTGLRGLLHAHREHVFELITSTSAVLSDMDYPEDYNREITALKKSG